MKMNDFFLSSLDREVERSRRALEQVPEGRRDWKPHDKSMAFGYLWFEEEPSWTVWYGLPLVIGSGLYILHRERVRAREARARAS